MLAQIFFLRCVEGTISLYNFIIGSSTAADNGDGDGYENAVTG